MRLLYFLIIAALSGCSTIRDVNRGINQVNRDINVSVAEALGTYTAPVLAGRATPSRCSDDRCRELDRVEAAGYEAVAQNRITYLKLVDSFYEARSQLYPDSYDKQWVFELRSFQRALAEQVDSGKVSALQWEYLNDQKYGELAARRKK
jgi:hypothetical protein